VEPPSAAEPGATREKSIFERIARGEVTTEEEGEAVSQREMRLFHLIGERLGTPLSSADRGRRFLELGFDSLGLSQLVARIRQGFGVRVPVRSLFEGLHTPGLLLAHLDSELPADEAPTEAGPTATAPLPSKVSTAPLTPSQREIWLSVRLGGVAASIAYNECRSFLLRGALDEGKLVACLDRLIERHEALRHTFSPSGEECRTGASCTMPLRRLDLRWQSEAARTASLAEVRSYEVATPFDLENGPSFRGALVHLSDDEAELVLCAHHICVDGTSWEILIRELATLYRSAGEADPLEPADSFSAYSARAFSASFLKDKERARAYWLTQLAGQSEDLDLPTDRSRTTVRSPPAGYGDRKASSTDL
jgi:acyl carrier protein